MTKLKLYNTLTRKKEEFKPIKKGEVGMYTCGPTVYWFAHVGNFRAYIFSDSLNRVLKFNGYKVKRIINVTDVGHLTSDSDEGEDKLEKAASQEGKTAKEISHFYFNAFLEDYKKLNLEEPARWSWATEHIKEQIELVKLLEKKGYTYKTSDGIYFDTSKFADYGKLSRKNIEELQGGKRISLGEKKNKTDFALWKFSNSEEKRQQEWKSPWGLGFPGWHIECSAMGAKYLGKQFDIHTGGEDHIPIHHENEIAQSECGYGVHPSVNYWMHNAFLVLPDGKMSKSKGTIKTISQLEKDGFDPLAYKYFTYSALYRKPLTWSLEGLENAQAGLKKLKQTISQIEDDGKINEEYLENFTESINDDLNFPQALAVLHKLISDKNAKGKYQTIKRMDEVLGLKLLEKEELQIPAEVAALVEERAKARLEKNWQLSDDLRDKIKNKGWLIKDTKESWEIEKI
jgi:cysteinyl-tRNA synthetase